MTSTPEHTEITGDERFARLLREPDFFMLLELTPALDEEPRRRLLQAVAQDPRIFGCLVTDHPEQNSPSLTDLAAEAAAITTKPVLAMLSGQGRDEEDVRVQAERCRRLGMRDFVAVTGDLATEHARLAGNAPLSSVTFAYTDSVDTLGLLRAGGADNVCGATVNPFKYTQEDVLAQYTKMIRKLNAGARFLVAQAGWDMAKFQELMWYLRSRERIVPLVARVPLLHPGASAEGLGPGVPLPLFLAASTIREAAGDLPAEQEVERAAMLALGCRLLGYSGILLSGIRNASECHALLEHFDAARAQLPNWPAWLDAWNACHAGVSFVPFGGKLSPQPPFYLYQALMREEPRDFDVNTARTSHQTLPKPAVSDILRKDAPDWLKDTLHKWRGKGARPGSVGTCLGLENTDCPKHLTQGPCGGSKIDGSCENGSLPCFFHRVIRLAAWNQVLERLEVPEDGQP